MLGYGNTSAAISKQCKHAQNVSITKRDTGGGGRDIRIIIPQGDVARLAARSKLPGAEKFESWIFDEVIPEVMNTGGYIHATPEMSDDEIFARALVMAKKKIEDRERQLSEAQAEIVAMQPKVEAHKAVHQHCKYAKLFKQGDLPGLGIGPRGAYVIPESDLYRLIMRSSCQASR